MIAVTFALPAESSAFTRKLSSSRRSGPLLRGELPHATSNIKHQTSNICVLHTGVGAGECEKRLKAFLAREQPRFLLSSGFCGGTNDEIAPGALIIAGNYSDPELANQARQVLPDAIIGKLYSATRVVDPAADRYEIGREHGAMAIDMETETIARLCAARSIPMLSLRVVSDSPGAPFPAPPEVLFDVQKQRTKFSRLLAHLGREPATAMRLVKFSRQIASARGTLADALFAVLGNSTASSPPKSQAAR